ncbi:hypothetical protein GON03_09245 [Nocardioides sp. MAH-18]|uniref:Uncharacterized protein n=1 Tax=Nocardioides agri TaxID=2682843 RepID=A0A6L6XSA2_9ACTN|nr:MULTISPECIES: hypothetical protein [unclassified Nocardioides]MBA2954505.1 hypothetical protein [Nocardioides sp. CGMCC 1.13656]MVQ49366.1 hypothetical protein [Nocardioides sp. MAH-18]
MRLTTALAGLIGGALLVLACFVAGDALRWAGLALLAVAALGAGAGLVSRSVPALRILVAVCFALLAGSVLSVLVDAVGAAAYAAVGTAGAVVALVVLVRQRPVPVAQRGHRAGGAHAR